MNLLIKYIWEELNIIFHAPVISGALILSAFLITALFYKRIIKAVKAENDSIKSENTLLKEKYNAIKEKAELNLNSQQKINIKDKFEFDKKTGLYKDKNGLLYCPSCLDKNKDNPLKELEHGWLCPIKECNQFYKNPEHKSMPNIVTIKKNSLREQLDKYY